jgi:hypothetical protein
MPVLRSIMRGTLLALLAMTAAWALVEMVVRYVS